MATRVNGNAVPIISLSTGKKIGTITPYIYYTLTASAASYTLTAYAGVRYVYTGTGTSITRHVNQRMNMNGSTGSTYSKTLTINKTAKDVTIVGSRTITIPRRYSSQTCPLNTTFEFETSGGGVEVSLTISALPTYKITYNGNGGTLTSKLAAGQTKYHGDTVKLLTDKPTPPSLFEFIGWNTNKTATASQYSPGANFSGNSNTTLYAIYKQQKTYAQCITDFNTLNVITTTLNQNYLYTPTKIPDNKRFLGWYKNPESLEPQTFLPDATTESTGASLYINASAAVTNSTAYSAMDKFVAVYADNTPTTYLPESYEAIHPEITSAGSAADFQTYINTIMSGDDYEQIDSNDSYHSLFGYIKYNQDTGLLYNDQITVTDLTTQNIYSTNIQKINNYVFWEGEDSGITTSHQYRVDFSARDNNRRLVTHSYVIKKKSKLIDISPGRLDINADAILPYITSNNVDQHIDLKLAHKQNASGNVAPSTITLAAIGDGGRGLWVDKTDLTNASASGAWLIRMNSDGTLYFPSDYHGSILSQITNSYDGQSVAGASLTTAYVSRFGNIVQLSLGVKNNNAIGAAGSWFIGTIPAGWRPGHAFASGSSYYGNRAIGAILNTVGKLTIQNASNVAVSAKTSSETSDHIAYISLTYILK